MAEMNANGETVTYEPCADCGKRVRLICDYPVTGYVVRGNPSEVICEDCAESAIPGWVRVAPGGRVSR